MTFYENAYEASPGLIQRGVNDRQRLLRNETEDFLVKLNMDYEGRRERFWDRDYSSTDAYLESIEPNRQRWLEAMGDFGEPDESMDVLVEPFAENDDFRAEWVTVDHFDHLRARGIVGIPRTGSPPYPAVICQHGVSSSPERTFGFDDDQEIYHAYAVECLKAGFAVISPLNIILTDPRTRYERLCKLLGRTLWGLEISKISRLIDYAETREEIDESRIGMWGISLGGAYTMFAVPIERRIRVAIICAWFNHRRRKMVVEDGRHSCFLPLDSEHIWVPGMLREFSDSDMLSLICPRPVMCQVGKSDGISWWPWVLEEYEEAVQHYAKLDIPDRIEMDMHEGGHEIRVESGLEFLRKWL